MVESTFVPGQMSDAGQAGDRVNGMLTLVANTARLSHKHFSQSHGAKDSSILETMIIEGDRA